MRFDLTLNIGHVLIIASMIVTVVAAWHAFKLWASVKIARFEETLAHHTRSLDAHASRLDKHEEVHAKLVGEVQRILGRIEYMMGGEPRKHPRTTNG